MRQESIAHEFVEFVPERPRQGVLYVSLTYNTAVHTCCCGCGSEVVTPISPVDWSLRYDGESVSLSPSIGNYSFPCRSHYWITKGRVEWAPIPSMRKIEIDREADLRLRTEYFGGSGTPSAPAAAENSMEGRRETWLSRMARRWFSR